MVKPRVLVISGATGLGKTNLAFKLAQKLGGEIVLADAVQIYQNFDIGSNKPPQDYIQRVKYHMLNHYHPLEAVDVHRYARDARSCIKDILSRGKVPIVEGGGCFYVKGMMDLHHDLPYEITDEIRKEADTIMRQKPKQIQKYLIESDPNYDRKVDTNDSYRMRKAVISVLATGKVGNKQANWRESQPSNIPSEYDFDYRCMYLYMQKPKLARILDHRCEQILQAGLLPETIHLANEGYFDKDKSPANAIGYREAKIFINTLRGSNSDNLFTKRGFKALDASFKKMLAQFQAATRQYASYQNKWFRREKRVIWREVTNSFGFDDVSTRSHDDQLFDDSLSLYEMDTDSYATELTSDAQLYLRNEGSKHPDLEKIMKAYKVQLEIYSDPYITRREISRCFELLN